MVMQTSSKHFPLEMREPLVMLLKTWAYCDFGEILLDIFKVALKSGFMTLLLATWNVGPDVVRTMWEQFGHASGRR